MNMENELDGNFAKRKEKTIFAGRSRCYYDWSKTYTANDYGRAGKNNKQVSSRKGLYPKDKRACSITGQNDNQVVMEDACELIIERAYDIDALSSFICGVREIDQLIHKKNGGLLTFISETPCEFYVVKHEESPIALFVLSNRIITLQEEKYNSLEIEFIAVRKDWRGKGIGKRILEIAEQNAREAEFPFLTTASFINKRYDASGFYTAFGFVRNGERSGNTIPMYKFLGPFDTGNQP